MSFKIITTTRGVFSNTWLGKSVGTNPVIAFSNNSGDNVRGLSSIYNEAIDSAEDDDILAFIHDDVRLLRPEILESQARNALKFYDVVGVVGSATPSDDADTWWSETSFKDVLQDDGTINRVFDDNGLSGSVVQYLDNHRVRFLFGPVKECKLLDGLLLIVSVRALRGLSIKFDEAFSFYFYDLDFCKSAEKAGLKIGTWTIEVEHKSFGVDYRIKPEWFEALRIYRYKWGRLDNRRESVW